MGKLSEHQQDIMMTAFGSFKRGQDVTAETVEDIKAVAERFDENQESFGVHFELYKRALQKSNNPEVRAKSVELLTQKALGFQVHKNSVISLFTKQGNKEKNIPVRNTLSQSLQDLGASLMQVFSYHEKAGEINDPNVTEAAKYAMDEIARVSSYAFTKEIAVSKVARLKTSATKYYKDVMAREKDPLVWENMHAEGIDNLGRVLTFTEETVRDAIKNPVPGIRIAAAEALRVVATRIKGEKSKKTASDMLSNAGKVEKDEKVYNVLKEIYENLPRIRKSTMAENTVKPFPKFTGNSASANLDQMMQMPVVAQAANQVNLNKENHGR